MKSICQAFKLGQTCAAGNNQPTPKLNIARKFVVACLTITMVLGPISGAVADEGFMVMQYEFELSEKPKFRQLNLAWQDNFGAIQSFEFEQSKKPNVVIPLYSTNPKRPGLFNRLDSADTEEGKRSKISVGAVVSTLVGLGVLAAYAYAAGKCTKHFLDGPDFYGEPDSDYRYCEAL